MAITVADIRTVSYSDNVNRQTSPIVVPAPAGLAVGDYYVIFAHCGSLGAGTTWQAVTGFTRLTSLGANPGRMMAAFGRYITDAAALSAVASVSISPGVATATRAGAIGVALRGVDPATPFAGESAWVVSATSVSSLTFPTAPGGYVMWAAYSNGATTTTHPVHSSVGGGTKVSQVTSFNASAGTYSEDTGVSSVAQSSTVMGLLTGGTGVAFATSAGTSGVIGIGLNAAVTASGWPKVWTGSAWASKPAKVWNGSAWVAKPVKVWTGSAWKTLT